jgi:A/G-specific adenine glycosylase
MPKLANNNPAALLGSRDRVTFRNRLLRWYDVNKRDLPWRNTSDPYRIWVSEIMLQQTRVAAVLEHYRRFLGHFPNVKVLARSREQSVLAAWSGLGYYRRARNLHAAAKVVAFERAGEFPKCAAELQELPGIGRYTAAAIASIAFGERAAVVDGNVERVLQRVTGTPNLGKQETWELAGALISPKRPADFNQAMMELGALVCLPREPKCLACPVIGFCATRGAHASAEKEIRKREMIAYNFVRVDDRIQLVQRPKDASLMPGMWELPQLTAVNGDKPATRFKHSILNTDYDVAVYADIGASANASWVSHSHLPKLALTGLARKILRHFDLL